MEKIMKNSTNLRIEIPSDNEGYILLKCPQCNEHFMITSDDIEDNIWCPSCGIISDAYFTDEVEELINNKIENFGMDILNEISKGMEKSFKRNKNIKFKKNKYNNRKEEFNVGTPVGSYTKICLKCCNKDIKINPLLSHTVFYCPFCGGLIDTN